MVEGHVRLGRVGSSPTLAQKRVAAKHSLFCNPSFTTAFGFCLLGAPSWEHLSFHHDNPYTLHRHADAKERFTGIFEPALLDHILSVGQHMVAPRAPCSWTSAKPWTPSPSFWKAPSRFCVSTKKATEFSCTSWSPATVAPCPWDLHGQREKQHPRGDGASNVPHHDLRCTSDKSG